MFSVFRLQVTVFKHFFCINIQIELIGRNVIYIIAVSLHALGACVITAQPVHGEGQTDRILGTGNNTGNIALTVAVFRFIPAHRESIRLVIGPQHLIVVPVGLQITQVADTNVGSYAFHLLQIPQGEGIVIAVSVNDAVFIATYQVIIGKVTGRITIGTIVIVPIFGSHKHRNTQPEHSGQQCRRYRLQDFAQNGNQSRHTHAYPYTKGIERTGVGIIPLARLQGRLIQIQHYGQPGHQKEKQGNPESLHALFPGIGLIQKPQNSQKQGQHIITVATLVISQFRRKIALITHQVFIDEIKTGNPVPVVGLAPQVLNIVLPAREIPHKVAPVHKINLIRKEEAQVFGHGRLVNGFNLTAFIVLDGSSFEINPILVHHHMFRFIAVHTRKEHIQFISHHRAFVIAGNEVTIFFVGRSFNLLAPHRASFFVLRDTNIALSFPFYVRGKSLSVNQRSFAILLTVKIALEGKHIVGRILIHRRLCI
ncbi:MAG: hypothetical protein BWX77_01160 [Bacteroidetes bacterium ADurb.Bin090]|nr:MAG: hypothetical protein BWX77_01160 [Bacteroidetes bacterium ADurb.Bin090]